MCDDRIVVTQFFPFLARQNDTRFQQGLPTLWHKDPVAVKGDGAVSTPAERLCERLTWIGFGPAVHESKLICKTFVDRDVTRLDRRVLTEAHRQVEVTSDDDVRTFGNLRDLIKDAIHLSRITPLSGRGMQTEDMNFIAVGQPSRIPEQASHNPTVVTRQIQT